MATLTIRNLDNAVHQALRERAAAHGRSMEAEVRAMLTKEFGPPAMSGAELYRRIKEAVADLEHDFAELELPEREKADFARRDVFGADFDIADDDKSDDAA